jgi:hypothetical protein
MEDPIDDLPDGITLDDPLEEYPTASRDDEATPDPDCSSEGTNENLLLPDEEKLEDVEKPHHNDGENE